VAVITAPSKGSSEQAAGGVAHSTALTLARDFSSPGLARAALQGLGAAHGWRSTDGELVLSELVTNAVRYGEGDIHVILCEVDGQLSGEVIDHGPGFARPRVRLRPISAGSWGLVIVAALTKCWGQTAGASRTWFEMASPSG
jgi:anti-sigma regulatory factor (Ser/Thr protein kinase)